MRAIYISIVAACLTTALYAGDGSIGRSHKPVADSYIVVLADRNADPGNIASEFGRSRGIKPVHIYDLVLNGFAFRGSEAAARAISADPRVKSVQEDSVVSGDGQVLKEDAPSWGLDRIDQQALPLDHIYAYEYTGYQTVIYVIDSGVNPTNTEFQGRVRERLNFVSDANGNVDPTAVNDCNDHGTGVAALAAGYHWGVAKQAQVVSVRVLDCTKSGFNSDIIAGVNWVVKDHQTKHPFERAVANMSFGTDMGTGIDHAEDSAVMSAVGAGITVVVSAGNDFVDACTRSPADLGNPSSYPTPAQSSVITVGMTTQSDSIDSQSNYGRCVDLVAPGRFISTLGKDGQVISGYGTSFAAPLVSGVAALHMERYNITNSPGSIEGIIKDAGTAGVISGFLNGTPNLLLYNSVPRRRACC